MERKSQVQIPKDLLLALFQYHLAGNEEYQPEIEKALMEKLDSMVKRQLYTTFKTAPTEEEREKARQEYLDKCGMHETSLVKILLDDLMTGACHAPVNSRQREGL